MVEQGLGGAVRGEKDFCVLILTGPDLVCMLSRQEIQRVLLGADQDTN